MSWESYRTQKLIDPSHRDKRVEALKKEKKPIATLNGSFDLLHAGHLYIIHEAAQTADLLIVALNSDLSVQGYKGSNRPIIPLKYRLEMVSALELVDYVTWFDESDPRQILAKIKPHVHVNGAEYGQECIEAETVQAHGGRIQLIPRIEGLATSDIIQKIQKVLV